jgi:hypothetical protein
MFATNFFNILYRHAALLNSQSGINDICPFKVVKSSENNTDTEVC